MEFKDLKRQYKEQKTEIDRQIADVISSSAFILGEKVSCLEQLLADYVGRRYCVSTGSGTDALLLSLIALGIKEGDAVFVPDFTYIASASVIARVNAHPIFVDIEKSTFNISCSDLREKIDGVIKDGVYRPRAIIAVDLFGLCADYGELEKIAEEYGLLLIEDAAQSFGSSAGRRMAGSFGSISCTSFFPAKPFGCYGDGGAVFTDEEDVCFRLRSLRSNGRSIHDKYDNVEIGVNSRLDELQAAILLGKLNAFKEFELKAASAVADRYTMALGKYITVPTIPDGFFSNRAQYTILLKDSGERSRVITRLKENGVPSMIYYPRGLHEQRCFAPFSAGQEHFPVTDYVKERCLSLPIHPYLTDRETDLVCSLIKETI